MERETSASNSRRAERPGRIPRAVVFVLALFISSCSLLPKDFRGPFKGPKTFERGMDSIADAISKLMSEKGWRRAAFSDFKGLNVLEARHWKYGQSVKEELVRRVTARSAVSVVDRRMSEEALKEMKTTFHVLVHPVSGGKFSVRFAPLKRFAELTYADVLVGGAFTDESGIIRMTLYFVEIDGGAVFLMEAGEFEKGGSAKR